MDLSVEALELIIANGVGLQSKETKCHFCGVKGRHLYVLVENTSGDEKRGEAGASGEAGTSSGEAGASSDEDHGPYCVLVPGFTISCLGDRLGNDFEHNGALVHGEYRGYCTHLDWDGKPWCDGCIMLGRDGGAVYPCCPGCCGIKWGAPADDATPEQVGRRCLWTPSCEEVWRGHSAT